MKQSKIGYKFAEKWLLKANILGPADEQTTRLFEKCTNLKQPFVKLKKTIVLLSGQVDDVFYCTKGLYETKN